MFDYKKILLELAEENREKIKEYAVKVGLIENDLINSYEEIESRCYRILNEFNKLIIFGIDGNEDMLYRLFGIFKEDLRVEFWVTKNVSNILGITGSNIKILNEAVQSKAFLDYGEYKLQEKTKNAKELILIDDYLQTDNKIGYIFGEEKEKNLCKWVSEFICEDKKLTILSYEEKTLLYIKGLIKGSGVSYDKIEFALLEGYQDDFIRQLTREKYCVTPIVSIEKDKNWRLFKRKMTEYCKMIQTDLKNK